MKGVVFLGDRKLELREFPDPTPGPRDADDRQGRHPTVLTLGERPFRELRAPPLSGSAASRPRLTQTGPETDAAVACTIHTRDASACSATINTLRGCHGLGM